MHDQPADLVNFYLADMGRIKRLSKVEQLNLAIEYKKAGNKNVRRCLIESFLPLIFHIAERQRRVFEGISPGREIELLDLVQEGNTALVNAVNSFDPGHDKRAELSTWVGRYVSYAIRWFIYTNISVAHIPIKKIGKIQKALNISIKYFKQHGHWPEHLEIAEKMKISPEEASEIIMFLRSPKKVTYINTAEIDGQDDIDMQAIDITDSYREFDRGDFLTKFYNTLIRVLGERDAELYWEWYNSGDYKLLAKRLCTSYDSARQWISRRARKLERNDELRSLYEMYVKFL